MTFPTKALVAHYKVQFFDEITLSWKDVQRTYYDLGDARRDAKKAALKYPSGKTRLMKILGKSREPFEEFAK